MNKSILLATLTLLSVIITSCEKWPLWVGKKEYITIQYQKDDFTGPLVYPAEYAEKSRFVSIDSIFTQQIADTVKVIVDGVRIKSNRNNFEILSTGKKQIEIFEKGLNDRKWISQSEFSNASDFENAAVSCVLVLDMSSSVLPVVSDLKSFANSFVDNVVNNGGAGTEIAVVFFSSKNAILETPFYNKSNISLLKDQINGYNNFQDRTALFQASINGLNKLTNFATNNSKCLVVFSDGGDNDSDFANTLQSNIENNYEDILRYSIGLKGNDLDRERQSDLKSIASEKSNFVIANKISDLKDLFNEVSQQLAAVYRLTYNRSSSNTDKIEIKFKIPVNKL